MTKEELRDRVALAVFPEIVAQQGGNPMLAALRAYEAADILLFAREIGPRPLSLGAADLEGYKAKLAEALTAARTARGPVVQPPPPKKIIAP